MKPETNQLAVADNSFHTSDITALRGVLGWLQTSCVLNGDQSTPGAPDDRATAMSALDASQGETTPVTLTVLPAFLP